MAKKLNEVLGTAGADNLFNENEPVNDIVIVDAPANTKRGTLLTGTAGGTLAAATATIDATAPGLENAGYTGVTIVKEQQTMCGKTYEGLRTTATIQGVAMYQRSVIFQQGKYLVSITATAIGEDVTQSILDNFYNLA